MTTIGDAVRTLFKLLCRRGIETSYSQDGEDMLIWSLLRGTTGTYIDVGAYHPVLYSNTYGLYRKGWKGIVIDANDRFRPLYRLLRPRDRFIHAAVGKEEKKRTYYRYADGAYNTLDDREAEKLSARTYPRLLG